MNKLEKIIEQAFNNSLIFDFKDTVEWWMDFALFYWLVKPEISPDVSEFIALFDSSYN